MSLVRYDVVGDMWYPGEDMVSWMRFYVVVEIWCHW